MLSLRVAGALPGDEAILLSVETASSQKALLAVTGHEAPFSQNAVEKVQISCKSWALAGWWQPMGCHHPFFVL
jgi:hypothetical protein